MKTIEIDYNPTGDFVLIDGVFYKPIEKGSRKLRELTVAEFHVVMTLIESQKRKDRDAQN